MDVQQEAHRKVELGESPRRLIRKRCRYSSFEESEDAFDTALHLMQKSPCVPGQTAKRGQVSNWWTLLFFIIVDYLFNAT